MRAIVIREPGGPDVLELREVPTPEPSRGEVRVRVRAVGVNRADVLLRLGRYPLPPGAPRSIPGLEFAGEVDALGPDVFDVAAGDRVFGLVAGGGYAEHVVLPARGVARIPDALPFDDAGGVPEAFVTAWDAMVEQAGLAAGETVLVHAAGSGVGIAAVQLGAAIGARVLGTTRTEEKLARARQMGLHEGVVVGGEPFAPRILALTGGRGVDVVVELVGGPYLAQDLDCLAMRGRVVVVGTLGGAKADLDLHGLMRKRAEVRGTVLAARPIEEKITAIRRFERHVVPLLERRAVRPVIDRVVPWTQAAEAHRVLEQNAVFGKVVLAVST
jgi:putative PIG3 family NAD(P)H quinone oxidoreductase